MQPSEFHSRLVEASIPALWLHWQDLGLVKTYKVPTPWPVDPEASLIGVLTIGRSDPRLYDAALTWWSAREHRVDVMRLDGLARRCPPEVRAGVSAWAATLPAKRAKRWRRFADAQMGDTPLFLDRSGAAVPVFGDQPKAFTDAGWLRGPLPSHEHWVGWKANSANRVREVCRAVFGPGARAEVVTALVLNPDTTTPDIETDAGYSRGAILSVLTDFDDSELVEWDRRRGGTGRVQATGALRAFLESLVPTNGIDVVTFDELVPRYWSHFYVGLSHLISATARLVASGTSGFEAESLLRDALEPALEAWSTLEGAPRASVFEAGTARAMEHVVEFVTGYAAPVFDE